MPGIQADATTAVPPTTTAAAVAAGLRALADAVEAHPELLSLAADALSEDFMGARSPPTPEQLPAAGPAPTLESRVGPRGTGLFRMVPFEMPEPEEDSEDEDDELADGGHIKVTSHSIPWPHYNLHSVYMQC